jgi:transposase
MGRKGQELSPDKKNIIVDLHLKGFRPSKICETLDIPYSTVFNILKKFKSSGSVENKSRSGRPALLTGRGYRVLERLVKKNRRNSLCEITCKFNENAVNQVSKRTVQRHLHKHNFKRRVLRKRVVVTVKNRKKRLSWCLQKRWWTVERQWKNVIFSDESQVVVGGDNRVYVWRKQSEGYRPDLIPSTKNRKFSVMIWGCICWEGVGTVTRVEGNIDSQKYISILDANLWPVLVRHFPGDNYLFQQDNAPVHTSRATSDFIAQSHIKTMSWPAQSPDLNIIENIWLFIKRKLTNRLTSITSEGDLFNHIEDIWTSISPEHIQSLYKSIPRRILQVIRLKGHLTKY